MTIGKQTPVNLNRIFSNCQDEPNILINVIWAFFARAKRNHAVRSHNSPYAAQTVTDSEGALGSLNRLYPTQPVILQNIQALPYPEGAHVVP